MNPEGESKYKWGAIKKEDKFPPYQQKKYGFPETPQTWQMVKKEDGTEQLEYQGLNIEQVDQRIAQLESIASKEEPGEEGLNQFVSTLREIRGAYPSSKLADIEAQLKKISTDYYGYELKEMKALMDESLATLHVLTKDRSLEDRLQSHAAD